MGIVICKYCGTPFVQKRPWHVFCPPPKQCRWLNWIEKHPNRDKNGKKTQETEQETNK